MKKNCFQLEKFSSQICFNIINAKIKKIGVNTISISKKIKSSLFSIFNENFLGIALDFDGTLIPLEKRTQITEMDLMEKLKKLNNEKIPIFILTGRGSSIITQFPYDNYLFKKYLFISQYNGGKIFLGNGKLISELKMSRIKGYQEIKQFLKELQK